MAGVGAGLGAETTDAFSGAGTVAGVSGGAEAVGGACEGSVAATYMSAAEWEASLLVLMVDEKVSVLCRGCFCAREARPEAETGGYSLVAVVERGCARLAALARAETSGVGTSDMRPLG